jgi:hypothetical protein
MLTLYPIEGDSPVIMSPTDLKMQPTIHLERKARCRPGKNQALPSKCFLFRSLLLMNHLVYLIIMMSLIHKTLQDQSTKLYLGKEE